MQEYDILKPYESELKDIKETIDMYMFFCNSAQLEPGNWKRMPLIPAAPELQGMLYGDIEALINSKVTRMRDIYIEAIGSPYSNLNIVASTHVYETGVKGNDCTTRLLLVSADCIAYHVGLKYRLNRHDKPVVDYIRRHDLDAKSGRYINVGSVVDTKRDTVLYFEDALRRIDVYHERETGSSIFGVTRKAVRSRRINRML